MTTEQTTERAGFTEAENRFEQMRHERHRIEERCEEAMNGLLEGLAQLKDLDARHQREAREAGIEGAIKISDFGNLIRPWLSSRLGGPGGYLPITRYIGADKPLPELDKHSRKPE